MSTQQAARRRAPAGTGFRTGAAVMAGIWLVFLSYPVISLFSVGLSTPALVWGLALVLVFAATYFLGFGWSHRFSSRQVGWWILVQAVPVALLVPLIGGWVFSFTTYFVAIFVFCLPWRRGISAAGLLVLCATGVLLAARPDGFWYIFGPVLLGPAIVAVVAWLSHREREQTALEQRVAVSEERESVARDVHDVLGHSLTVISLKAEVAARAVGQDPERARAELEEIAQLSRVALAEVRSTVTRLRVPDFSGEIQAAQRALTTAGIRADLPTAETAQRIAGGNATLFSWALREAVTNVVRHSGASSCTVRVSPEKLQVEDDGAGLRNPRGNGLTGLAERIRDAGGRLVLEPLVAPGSTADGEPTGTRLLVTLSGDPSPLPPSDTADARETLSEETAAWKDRP